MSVWGLFKKVFFFFQPLPSHHFPLEGTMAEMNEENCSIPFVLPSNSEFHVVYFWSFASKLLMVGDWHFLGSCQPHHQKCSLKDH